MTVDTSTTHLTERVLSATARLLAERELNAVSVADIADAAEITVADVDRVFLDKVEIVHELILRSSRALLARQRALDLAVAPPAERLARLIHVHIEFRWQHRTVEILRRDFLPTLRSVYPSRYREAQRQVRAYHDHVAAIVREGQDSGEFTCGDAALATTTLLEMVNGILNWYQPDDDLPLTDLSDVYVDLILRNVLGWSAPHRATSDS